MEKAKLIEDIITRRLLSGDTAGFITELKQADVTPTEAKTADLFGDPKIGELIGVILEKISNNEALEPSVGELQSYLRNSTEVTNPVESTRESFSMDKEKLSEDIDSKSREPMGNVDSLTTDELVAKVGDLESQMGNFSQKLDRILSIFSEDDVKAKGTEEGTLEDAAGNEIDSADPEESAIEYSEDGVTIHMSMDKYRSVKRALRNIENFAESEGCEDCEDTEELDECDRSFSENGVTIHMSMDKYKSVKRAIRNIENFAESVECEDCDDTDELDECARSFSEDGVTIRMSMNKYRSVKRAIRNIENFAEESEDMVSLPRRDYERILRDIDEAKGDSSDEMNASGDDDHEEMHEDMLGKILKRLDELEAKLSGAAKEEPTEDKPEKEVEEDKVVIKDQPKEENHSDESSDELTEDEKKIVEGGSNFSQQSTSVYSYLYEV